MPTTPSKKPRTPRKAKKKPNKAGMGAPEVIYDWETADDLATLMATGEEIASILGMDYDTLLVGIKARGFKTFSEYIKRFSGAVKVSLRRRQISSALAGNVTMLIWTGKQLLDQREPDRDGGGYGDDDDDEGLHIHLHDDGK